MCDTLGENILELLYYFASMKIGCYNKHIRLSRRHTLLNKLQSRLRVKLANHIFETMIQSNIKDMRNDLKPNIKIRGETTIPAKPVIQPPKEFLKRSPKLDSLGLPMELPSTLTFITFSKGGCQHTCLREYISLEPPKDCLVECKRVIIWLIIF